MAGKHAAPRRRTRTRSGGGAMRAHGAFAKDMVRMWGRNWKRFASITVICMLGVAVLTGIYAGCRDMFLAANRFYTAQGLHDIQVVSTLGLTDGDVTALEQVEGVAKVSPERSQSVETDLHGSAKSVTIREITGDGLDRPYLQRGRMPETAGEVAVTESYMKDSGRKLGDRIAVSAEDDGENDGDTTDTSEETGSPSFPTDLTIVGVVLDPQDLSNPDGYGTVAFRNSSASDYTFFAPSDGVTGSVYTAINLTVKGAADLDTFTKAYDREVDDVVTRISDEVRVKRQNARHDELVKEVDERISDARAEADDQFAQAQSTIDRQRAAFDQQLAAMGASEGARREAALAASPELAQAAAQLDEAQLQLDRQKADATAKLDEERTKAVDAIGKPRWYVQTRTAIGGFNSLKSDVTSIESIGRAFPVVFLLVAVLMGLTTMTRLVEEDRGLIGTYTALGYGSAPIASRYLAFALLACLIGGGLGCLVGFLGIPAFLLVVLEGLYVIPGIRLEYDWATGSAGVLLFVVGVGLATLVACRGEMRQTPAELMRPKSPKAGARVLLERIRPLWRRLKFLDKVTVRNLFRFKGRLVMTVGGVAGCTALIVCGFAISNTVDALGPAQYGGIYRYDMLAVSGDGELDALRSRLEGDGRVTDSVTARIDSSELTNAEGESETVQLVTVEDGADLASMIELKAVERRSLVPFVPADRLPGWLDWLTVEHVGGSALPGKTGVVVSQSAANVLGVEAGDSVTLRGPDMQRERVKVTAVSRNLIGTDVYMTRAGYEALFGADDGGSGGFAWNAVYAKLDGDEQSRIDYAEKLGKAPEVLSATSTDDMRASFTFDLMGAVVALIVALAGALALVVLFTLANTNVSERVREMATLKVLGFFDREVHRYVHREMLVLTLMGIAVGLPLGRWVGGLLTAALNMPSIYFEVRVAWWSYAVAAGVTLAFALVVQLLTNPVLDRIDPVVSLKSVE